jgi:hypothetical protein
LLQAADGLTQFIVIKQQLLYFYADNPHSPLNGEFLKVCQDIPPLRVRGLYFFSNKQEWFIETQAEKAIMNGFI